MQVRFSTALGLSITDEEVTEEIGTINGILIHPDTGRVEGFFVRVRGFLRAEDLFLSSFDIQRWGLRVVVRDRDVLAPLSDHIRFQTLRGEGRGVLGQRIVTETGRSLGRCADVQFETKTFRVEWLWPRKLFWWGTPLPITQVVEVRKDAIVVRDTVLAEAEKEEIEAPLLATPEAA